MQTNFKVACFATVVSEQHKYRESLQTAGTSTRFVRKWFIIPASANRESFFTLTFYSDVILDLTLRTYYPRYLEEYGSRNTAPPYRRRI